MRTVLFAVVYILSTGLSFPLRAEVPDTVNLALIEVKADYLFRGEMEQRISQTIIEGFKGNDLGTLLATGSHLYIKSDGPGGLATASFRGTSANHTLVLWNDIPLNGPSLGSVDFSTIPVFFTDQIGISWGSKAAGFQTGGLGGGGKHLKPTHVQIRAFFASCPAGGKLWLLGIFSELRLWYKKSAPQVQDFS